MNCESGDPAYRRLKDQLTASTGLSFEGERDQSLAESVGRRISDLGLRDCAEYAGLLTDSGGSGAEMDVLMVISNCPQLNNPCNGYNPTPIQVLIWEPNVR